MSYRIVEREQHYGDGTECNREEYKQTVDGVAGEIVDNFLHNNIKNLKIADIVFIRDLYYLCDYIYIEATGYLSCGGESKFSMYIYYKNSNGEYTYFDSDSMILERICATSPLLEHCVEKTKQNRPPVVVMSS